MSSLSGTIRRTSDALRLGAAVQVSDYEQRLSSLKNLNADLLSSFIRMGFDRQDVYQTVKEFFGTSTVRFAGIDGTMYSRPLFDLVIFFGGAYASTGTITFEQQDPPTVTYDMKTIQQSAGISTVVPIYVNEIPEMDQAFYEGEKPGDMNPNRPLTDQSIIDNATVANWIMTFSEYYLAYKLACDEKQQIRVLLLDRSLSIERASLIYDTAKRDLWKARCSLIGYRFGKEEPLDMNDLTIARQSVCNEALGLPPPRGDYLGHAVIQLVKAKGSLDQKEICDKLRVNDEKRMRRVTRSLKRAVESQILTIHDGVYELDARYTNVLERVKKLVVTLGERFFCSDESKISNVMKIVKDGKEDWLTTTDIAFLTLFTLHMLMEECWRKHILLIGMTKDTAARDFKRQLVPIMHNEGFLATSVSKVDFEKLPNTDRMVLQSTSILNPEEIVPPWSLMEYDSAFRTMIVDPQNRKGFVSGAIKNRIGLEKTFIKTYVQLSQAKSDPVLRSNVLLIDRLVYPEFDCKPENLTTFQTEFGGAKEPVEVILFKDKDVPNKLQNLIMTMLVAMAPTSIPEAFGHNKPLFIADKIAKWNYGQFKLVVDSTADWILNNHKLRKFIFYMSTFRERRASIEAARRDQI
ncbi:MAG TPA: hypothetical protein VJ529_01765 [Candidatus Bathyarchaeia archaeon]|nr:hypothetical protein [Candidatus Bathyarchaeia archaeon]